MITGSVRNAYIDDIKKVLTRMHDNCKVILIGHTGQNDLIDKSKSGFARYLEHYRGMPGAEICELTKNYRGWISSHADALE